MLEVVESADMNRILEHGFKVKMVPTEVDTYAVDTLEDLANVEAKMKDDPLMKTYISF
jgi:3-deoxy-manno-octulosonate cytidylyltransferase (CMP-KDO synthetase)